MLKKVSLEVLAALTTRTDSTSSVQVAASVHGDSAESVEAAVMELKDRLGRNVEAAENILHSNSNTRSKAPSELEILVGVAADDDVDGDADDDDDDAIEISAVTPRFGILIAPKSSVSEPSSLALPSLPPPALPCASSVST